MKATLYLCSLVFFALIQKQAVYAQTDANEPSKKAFASGTWQIGLKDGYSRGSLLANYNSLQAHAGYYFANKLLVGIGAGWSKEWAGNIAFTDLTVGPLVRYQFTRTRLSPFLEATYQFGHRQANEDWQATYPGISVQTVSVSPGLSIGVTTSLRVDVSYGFQHLINGHTGTYSLPQIGINYLLTGN